LDGEGARLNGGRWNSEGNAVVYLASTLALAAIEYLVHVDIEDVPTDLIALQVEVPDDSNIEEVALDALPTDWYRTPDAAACLAVGDEWIRRASRLLLRVPSAIIPGESNILLNPAHPDAGRVEVRLARPFVFDRRLLR
jgi:RES domain-containing protein